MRAPHLLRVDAPPEAFATLFAAAKAEGLRLGWLDLGAAPAVPAALETAAAAGALRAVAVGEGRVVAAKALAGLPVLHDLLREHFLGCAAVLVRGEGGVRDPEGALAAAPQLEGVGEGWRLGGEAEPGSAPLLARLRRPRSLSPEPAR